MTSAADRKHAVTAWVRPPEIFAAENFADPLVEALVSAGVTVAPAVLKSISIVVITLVLAYFNLVFGELVPSGLP